MYVCIWQRETAKEGTQAGRVKEGEAGFSQSREPDAGIMTWAKDMLNGWVTQVPLHIAEFYLLSFVKDIYICIHKDFWSTLCVCVLF